MNADFRCYIINGLTEKEVNEGWENRCSVSPHDTVREILFCLDNLENCVPLIECMWHSICV